MDVASFNPYSPGLLTQDVYTIPLELALIGAANAFYSESTKPLWPFENETNNGTRNATRHPKSVMAPVAGSLATATLATAYFTSKRFEFWTHLRGWTHAHLLTELTTAFAKVSFQRHRPFYDTEKKLETQRKGHVRKDDSFSFFSSHASHAFAFATYGSSLLFHNFESRYVSWGITGALFSGAAFIAGARAADGQHHWSDVAVGATVGTVISRLVYNRVESVLGSRNPESKKDSGAITVTPVFMPGLKGPLSGIDVTAKF